MNRFQQCLLPGPKHPIRIRYVVMSIPILYRSSFSTFPSFLNPRAHSAHNTWTTLWNFRSFSSKMQYSFTLSTITQQWKFSYRMFTYILTEISFSSWMYPKFRKTFSIGGFAPPESHSTSTQTHEPRWARPKTDHQPLTNFIESF